MAGSVKFAAAGTVDITTLIIIITTKITTTTTTTRITKINTVIIDIVTFKSLSTRVSSKSIDTTSPPNLFITTTIK